MTDSTATHAATTEADFDALLHANLARVFNQRDAAKRREAVGQLFSPTPTLYEPDAIVQGQQAIADVAGALLEQFGDDFAFVPTGAALGHHGLGYLRWQAGPKNGPAVVTGVDVVQVSEGRIAHLWVLLDPPVANG